MYVNICTLHWFMHLFIHMFLMNDGGCLLEIGSKKYRSYMKHVYLMNILMDLKILCETKRFSKVFNYYKSFMLHLEKKYSLCIPGKIQFVDSDGCGRNAGISQSLHILKNQFCNSYTRIMRKPRKLSLSHVYLNALEIFVILSLNS